MEKLKIIAEEISEIKHDLLGFYWFGKAIKNRLDEEINQIKKQLDEKIEEFLEKIKQLENKLEEAIDHAEVIKNGNGN